MIKTSNSDLIFKLMIFEFSIPMFVYSVNLDNYTIWNLGYYSSLLVLVYPGLFVLGLGLLFLFLDLDPNTT